MQDRGHVHAALCLTNEHSTCDLYKKASPSPSGDPPAAALYEPLENPPTTSPHMSAPPTSSAPLTAPSERTVRSKPESNDIKRSASKRGELVHISTHAWLSVHVNMWDGSD